MQVTVEERPEAVIDLEEAKRHLRVDHDDDDAAIEALIATAQGSIDGPFGWLRRAVGSQSLMMRLPGDVLCGRCPIRIPYGPVISVLGIAYDDLTGTEQTLADGDVEVVEIDGIPHLLPVFGTVWPQARCAPNAVRITWRAGFADPAQEIPPIRHAVLLMVGHYYQNPEAVVVGASVAELPLGVERLLAPYRVWGV